MSIKSLLWRKASESKIAFWTLDIFLARNKLIIKQRNHISILLTPKPFSNKRVQLLYLYITKITNTNCYYLMSFYHLLSTVLKAWHTSSHLIFTSLQVHIINFMSQMRKSKLSEFKLLDQSLRGKTRFEPKPASFQSLYCSSSPCLEIDIRISVNFYP